MTSGSPFNRLLEKVKDLIPIPPQKEKYESPLILAENEMKNYCVLTVLDT